MKSADNVAASKGRERLDNGDGCGHAKGGLRVRQDDLPGGEGEAGVSGGGFDAAVRQLSEGEHQGAGEHDRCAGKEIACVV